MHKAWQNYRGPLIIMAISLAIGILIYPIVSEKPLRLIVGIVFLSSLSTLAKNPQSSLDIALFFLPFTQVPTIKVFIRWRISEVIAWFLLPNYGNRIFQTLKQCSPPVRLFLNSMLLYILYTGLVGILLASVVEIRNDQALGYFVSPFFRTILETARGLGAFSLVMGLMTKVKKISDIQKVCAFLTWAGAVSSLYSLYQAIVLAFGLSLPLLPETLYHEGNSRPFGTFYEPTGTGSFTAATILLNLYFLTTSPRKIIWLICLTLNIVGFFVSLSRAGWLGLLTGAFVLICCSVMRSKNLLSLLSIIIAAGGVLGGRLVANLIFSEQQVEFALSEFWIRQTLPSRIGAYSQIYEQIYESFGVGFGQGLYIFHAGGAPGFVRLIVEGGIIGTFLLLLMHISIILCFKRLWMIAYTSRLTPFLIATYLSCTVTTLNYINTTDMWIGVMWSLPVLSLKAMDDLHKQTGWRVDSEKFRP